MAVAGCPHCRANLRIDPEFAGQTLQCPSCGGAFISPNSEQVEWAEGLGGGCDVKRSGVAPNFEQMEAEEDEGFPLPALLVCIGGAHIVLFVILAIVSPVLAFFLVGVALAVELAIWKRKELMAIFQQVQQSETTRQILDQAKSRVANGVETAHSLLSPPGTSPRGSEIVSAEVISEVDDSLVEIRPARPAQSRPRTVSHISHPEPRRERPSMWGTLGGRPLEAKLPQTHTD